MIYGFSEETVKKLKKGSLVEVVITMAKMGLKGDCTTKRRDLEKRIEENEYKITTSSLGIYGGKESRFGIVIEYISHIRVGLSGGAGIMVYDWRNYEFEG